MKLKFCAFLILALSALAHGQDSTSSNSETIVTRPDGTSTLTKLNEKGAAILQVAKNSDGSINRRTMLQYDSAGHCISWLSTDSHRTLDSGQKYIYDGNGVLNTMLALDGTLLYQK